LTDIYNYQSVFGVSSNRSAFYFCDKALNIGSVGSVTYNPCFRFDIKTGYAGTRINW